MKTPSILVKYVLPNIGANKFSNLFEIFIQDAAMLREFDDLMRSTSTMKVSLTPDRLKTMEVRSSDSLA